MRPRLSVSQAVSAVFCSALGVSACVQWVIATWFNDVTQRIVVRGVEVEVHTHRYGSGVSLCLLAASFYLFDRAGQFWKGER